MRRLLLTATLMLSSLGASLPAQAFLGYPYDVLKNYRVLPPNKKSLIPEEKIKTYIALKKELNPVMVRFFTDIEDDTTITRMIWMADMQLWTYQQAEKVRQFIMSGYDTPVGYKMTGIGPEFYYAKGSKVYYRMSRGKVINIVALSDKFDPGDLGQMPAWHVPKLLVPGQPKPQYTPPPNPSP